MPGATSSTTTSSKDRPTTSTTTSSENRDADHASIELQPVHDWSKDPTLAETSTLHAECPAYVEMVKRAYALASENGFDAIEKADIIRRSGPDNAGRPVFMFFPNRLPKKHHAEIDLDRFTLYGIWLMHKVVMVQGQDFTVLWCCGYDGDSRVGLNWFRKTYWSMPYEYHKKVQSICVVHPDLAARFIQFALSYMVKVEFWDKVNWADRLEFLDQDIPVALIKTLPDQVKRWDKRMDEELYARADEMTRNPHKYGGGLGGGHGGFGHHSHHSHGIFGNMFGGGFGNSFGSSVRRDHSLLIISARFTYDGGHFFHR
jgi:hypothetical protein